MKILALDWVQTDYDEKIARLLRMWEGTPYLEGQQVPQAGVDCFRFVCGVLDAMEQVSRDIEHIPADQSMHDRAGALAAMRSVMERYAPYEIVLNNTVEAGDVLVTGPKGGGPGHAMLVGPTPGHLWHVPGPGKAVCRSGSGFHGELHRIYRVADKDKRWING